MPIADPTMTNASVVAAVRAAADRIPEAQAYVFLGDGETETGSYTFAELDGALRRVGGWLQQHGLTGQRVLLTIEPGELYVTALLACLYAGAAAVPCYPPRPNAAAHELATIANDCRAAAILASPLTAALVEPLRHHIDVPVLNLTGAEGFSGDEWHDPGQAREDVALLQYTSGSTGAPKGVMVCHGDILVHIGAIATRLRVGPGATLVSWLPPYHDMGLVAFVVMPPVIGVRCVTMSPLDFVSKPVRWLQAMTRYRGNFAASPNFGYDLCADRVRDDAMAALDLSSWRWAGNGAEPVRASTMHRFAERFSLVGFGRRVFSPCYGLAEATLAVTLAREGTDPHSLIATVAAEDDGGEADLAPVGCGEALDDHRVVVVDPDNATRCDEGVPGEIWVTGPSVPGGYWSKPEQSARTFHAALHGDPDRWLRTGDMGVLRHGQLYVVGRYRDVIVVRGRNYAPADIEYHAAAVDARARAGCGAVFTVARAGRQQVIVLQEMRDLASRDEAQQLTARIRERILVETGLRVDQVVLLAPRGLPKTTSGKIQRRAARARYLAGTLPLAIEPVPVPAPRTRASRNPDTQTGALESLLLEQLEPLLEADAVASSTRSFADQGMDSVHGAAYLDNLSVLLGRDLRLPLLYEFPTVWELARHLATAS
jgi:acyl-CoA synthetase (AMP-forming)/AMP-acid ligase II